MKNIGNMIGIMIAVLIFIAIIGAVIALEVWLLILLGFTYESWQAFALFIIVFGIVEFVVALGMKGIVQAKAKSHPLLHMFWWHIIISFTLMMIAVNSITAITIPTVGAIIYAVITSLLYLLTDRMDKKDEVS